MLPKGTMAIVVEALAKIKFNERNELDIEIRARTLADEHAIKLDTLLESSLRKALGGKRISKERQDIIVNEFCDRMLGVK
ncbi:hypothetical protein [Clostridium estertheticum]|uniref:hypothetical protein n=1 Tax=Clostridium estertheticum TaxID=238834 RepID=UPI001C7D6E2C|nr:hypothetical protein [Clostridium estertheticum]MBX4266570.1 hypothetical protein [Clostridium estertheticum]WLC88090.1 hypothetical protein KTC95_19045 [Clostridium estertheticum]